MFEQRLQELGSEGEGERALGLLRDAHAILSRPDQYQQPYVIAQSACRTAIECLMDLGGTNYAGLLDARNHLAKSLKQVFNPDGSRKVTKPLPRLLVALDVFDEFPDAVPAEGDLRDALVSLHRSRTHYRVPLPEIGHAKALEQMIDVLDGLEDLPTQLPKKHPLTVALRELHAVRMAPAFRRDAAVLERQLEAVGAAYARLLKMEEAQGSRRIQQVTALAREVTGREPGAGELKAYKAWSDYYQSASEIIHKATGTGAARAVRLLHDVLTVISELVFTLPDQADRWVRLAAVSSPTSEQIEEVNRLHHPSATSYLFSKFTGWEWLEGLTPERLLPEADRWPAAPYFQRLAAEDPARLALWLQSHLDKIGSSGPGAITHLIRLCRHLPGHAATPLVGRIIRQRDLDGVGAEVLFWALGVNLTQRDVQWVDVLSRVLVTGAGASPIASWDLQESLAQLQESARINTSLTTKVRTALVDVLAAHLAVGDSRLDLQIRDDLRSPTRAGSPTLANAWRAAAACLEFGQVEQKRGTDLETRTAVWRADVVGGWEQERLLAVHLLDVAGDEPDEEQWWALAFSVLTRLDSMRILTPDVAAFVRTAMERCSPERKDQLATALRDGLGPVPDATALHAARTELDDQDSRLERALSALALDDELPEWEPQVPAVWRTIWALSKVLPAAALTPYESVVELLTEYFGPPPAVTEPVFKFLPLPDTTGEDVAEFRTLCKQNGAVHGATVLAGRTPTPGSYFERMEFRILEAAVHDDADAWAADIEAVMEELNTFDLRTVYLSVISTDRQAAGLANPGSTRTAAAISAAWQLMSQLRNGAGSSDPDLRPCPMW
ncbi:hypothetical protein ACFYXP_31960 [Streptomyces sp. NPDC002466]|uniref:hypothetical protein n=1 Tax=Streptomyces sp. NPDC002466 TaxID=3364646 RepID=UPI0036AAE27A